MECLRGFSFMPEQKIDVKLQYIEGEELERTWKTTRRQRVKEQEQKIWDDFVKEQDVLSSVCRDDPYQFLEQLPEECLKELMEIELQKMRKETEIDKREEDQEESPAQQGDGDSPRREDEPPAPGVTFAEDVGGYDSDVIHIFDDEKDDDQSGQEDETLVDSPDSPPCTVRDNFQERPLSPRSPPPSPDKVSIKSSENVTSMIETSIYCAKVKDLRMKIHEEITSIINSLELREREILVIDPEDLVKMCRRSTEFCARFNRIYMYQLHRQIHDVKRNNDAALPFARHTQFQSQMVRIASLHQNLLQSLQMFHKSFEQTGCVRESADMLRCLARAARDATAASRAAPPPAQLPAARDLYDDAVLPACDRLDDTIDDFAAKISTYMNSTANTSTSRSKKDQSNRGKRSIGTWSKSGPKKNKSMAESRLSMYSLDTLRVNMHPKSSSSKDNQSSAGTSKIAGGVARRAEAPAPKAGTPRKSPRSRRPLMRAPAGRARARRGERDDNVRTLVEAVEACTSSHISREPSPHHSSNNTPRRRNNTNNNNTPAPATPRRSNISPRKLRSISPKKTRRISPQPVQMLGTLSSIRSDPFAAARELDVAQQVEPLPEPPTPSPRVVPSPRQEITEVEREKPKITNGATNQYEVSRIVRQLCGGDAVGNRNERVSGAKNAQLHCISGASSPRQPSTPQLLRILEETIQKKVPKALLTKAPTIKNADRFRLTFNISEKTADNLFLYRTKFVQHMLSSPMYANSIVGKPWEMISSVSEQIIDDLLLQCAEEMQLRDVVQHLYQTETT